ncbi:MAG TPA: hypothetical protein VGH28_01290 [Polyangiaceae bacterium]
MKKFELDDLVRDAKKDAPDVDWKTVDEKLFARLEKEPTPLAPREEIRGGGRVVWIGAALSLAAAAAALVFVHPSRESVDTHVETAAMESGHGALALGDRIDVTQDVAYFDSPGKVRWSAPRGSVLRVEHASSPLVLSLEHGAAEAQVTPVPSGEAFAIDVTASSGAVVRVAVHGTHLRVARDGDNVTIDLTEGVVSIGAPPRRGSTIGTLVTAPAHVELDARDLAAIRVDHEPSSVRPAESLTPSQAEVQTALLSPSPIVHETTDTAHEPLRPQLALTQPKSHAGTNATTVSPEPQWLTTPDEMAAALSECGRDALAPHETFSTSLALTVRDDGTIDRGRFTPPLLPEARDCADSVIYRRTKLATPGAVTVPVRIVAR